MTIPKWNINCPKIKNLWYLNFFYVLYMQSLNTSSPCHPFSVMEIKLIVICSTPRSIYTNSNEVLFLNGSIKPIDSWRKFTKALKLLRAQSESGCCCKLSSVWSTGDTKRDRTVESIRGLLMIRAQQSLTDKTTHQFLEPLLPLPHHYNDWRMWCCLLGTPCINTTGITKQQ